MLPIQTKHRSRSRQNGVHTEVGNYEIFTTSVEAMDEALKAPKSALWLTIPNSKPASKPFPGRIRAICIWTGPRVRGLERQLPILKLLEIAGKPFLATCDH